MSSVQSTSRPTRTRAAGEILAALVTGVVPLVFEQVLHPRWIFIAGACTAWIAYIAFRIVREPGIKRAWGVARDGFRPALADATRIGVVVALCVAIVAAERGSLRWSWHFLWTLLLYPLWGIVQQFIVQAMGTRNFVALGVPRVVVVVLGGAFFALAHWPDPVLMGATWAMGFLFTIVYLRHGNLLPLGVWHGLLGACFYFWILGRDSWAELVGSV